MTSEDRAAVCDGKSAFPRWSLAKRASKRHRGLAPYRCPACGAWHVGTERILK